jgi:branched-chain amino acid transport system substrate-binding protein
MRRLWVVVCIVVLAAAGQGAAAPSQTIKLGAVVPITGRYGAGGAQVKAGYEIAVDDVNAAGGITVGGQKVRLELQLLDDESDPTKTVSRFEALAQDGANVYLGGFGSDLHAAAAAVAEKNRIPYCGVAFALHAVHERGFRFLFSPFPKSPDLAVETYKLLNSSIPADQRPKRVAIFQERTDWGRELGDIWTARSSENGYQVVLRADYAPLSRDLSDIILRAKNAGADAVFSLPTPPDGITLIRQMKELDFNPKLTIMFRAADAVSWTQSLGKDGDDVVLAPGWHSAVRFPGVQALNAKHQQRFGRPADVIVGPAYACVQIVADAVRRAGKVDPVAIRDAIAATNLQTVIGPVRFRPDGTGMVTTVFVQWQAGKQQLVWPKDLGGTSLKYPATPWRSR